METKGPSEGYTTDIHPAKSILDQVDDYLNEKHDSQGKVEWQSMQVDLDQLSHTLFENRNDNQQQQQQQQQQVQLGQGHVRPDMVFSPMGSPMVVPNHPSSVSANATPFLGGSACSNSNSNTPFLGASSGGFKTKKNSNRNVNSQFSPLTSPALVASDQQQMLNFALPESSVSRRTASTTSVRGKRVPVNSASSKVVKNSPNLTSRRRYSSEYLKNCNSNNSWDDLIFKLPENGLPLNHINQNHHQAPAGEEYPSPDAGVPSSPESKVTPATLMNYPKVILPSNRPRSGSPDKSQSPDGTLETDLTNGNNDHNNNSNDNNNNNGNDNGSKIWRATESPVIRPRHSVSQSRPQVRNSQLSTANSNSTSSSSSVAAATAAAVTAEPPRQEGIHRVRSKTSRSSSVSLNGNAPGAASPGEEDEYSKREVHKVAEQGRRNRLNFALAELNALLPPEIKDAVSIPSKATTVELACTYIKQLLEQTREKH
ncbi:hypothetical protein ZYGR_0N06730 [Zygosaccharomyces rouxii]|uniref:ZYRO0D15730p n=2 Tax=Zygosaccharomyces rouxii TaxID=4956 RepID=C5DWL2_ZYGRC|nr:uncharacterized protein ZYRO0D15730g [Zygosaccharomyces rouxii]KAH9201092.1 hypothetical protein LQ764DRAFT_103372 [Zygosaccharomyces rouxii]GAV49266.1 hypothetical protein ZYGR_0N06730 [Zygosaccharomyces rouxii]CAR28181.1 ZYRO0D15730p [Zygosaccharomyces rouxii]